MSDQAEPNAAAPVPAEPPADAAQARCAVCQALLDEEDLFCPNCGAESPRRDPASAVASRTSTHNFVCSGCGASMSYDASAGALRCPFCGSTRLESRPDYKVLSPERVVPFAVDRAAAAAKLRQWLGRGFWRPGDLARQAEVVSMTAVYVPYWVFAARTHSYWTADTSQTPPGARASWYPLAGEHQGEYSGLLIGASGALAAAETGALCPFDLSAGVAPQQVDLDNVIVEEFSVPRKYARPLARAAIENLESEACDAQYVPGQSRNVKVSVRVLGLTSQPVLLPVWMMAYRYRDEVFRFLVNGQTGRSTGTAPISWYKIAVAVGIAGALVIALLALLTSR